MGAASQALTSLRYSATGLSNIIQLLGALASRGR
jgi:hypothetical protein